MRLLLILFLVALLSSCTEPISKLSVNSLVVATRCNSIDVSQCVVGNRDASELSIVSTLSSAEPAAYCCKVCSTGKACGDSCISRDKECHKPPGCACNR
jgi:hypothetical protein